MKLKEQFKQYLFNMQDTVLNLKEEKSWKKKYKLLVLFLKKQKIL